VIDVSNVSLHRGSVQVLSDVSFVIPKGGVTALVGPNGAGKSSLLALMARLLPLQAGSISIDGHSIAATPGRELARIVSILRQDPSVSSRLRVAEFVGFGRFPHSRGRLTAHDRRKIDEALDMFDLSDLSGRFVDTLSGGQRQRVMVAMTYCQDCGTMLLDEPLNSLDMFHARQLMRILRRVADEHLRTVVIVLHDINQAATHADRIIALREGRLVANDTTAAIMNPATLQAIFGYPIEVASIDGTAIALHHR